MGADAGDHAVVGEVAGVVAGLVDADVVELLHRQVLLVVLVAVAGTQAGAPRVVAA